jgi:two-component system, chemotaxis family, CheB/CheR fusion protein
MKQLKAKKLKPTASTKKKVSISNTIKFPVVGIGASAGGLEALEQFISNVPANSGVAYVVVQHLDPTQKGMLPELLQRVSKMKVLQVKDRMPVKPDFVYVIPPNKSMSILKGKLFLFEPIEERGLRLPIDFFLRSLADDMRELSVGIILSGMGSDGSFGLRSVKEKKGIAMVQDPVTAKFDSMPRNAMDSAFIDIVAPSHELPSKLMALLKNTPVVMPEREVEFRDKSSLDKIIILLRTHTGNDFSLYKKNTVYRRIERRMGIHKINKISSYVHFLQENPKEAVILFKELMIGVTGFFRDKAIWEKLKETVFPALIAIQPTGSVLRAWIPGCSTGEEAYSLAIVFKEVLEKTNLHRDVVLQIFATDLDNEAIETARKGLFSENIAADVSPEQLKRFFNRTEDGYRVNSEIREMIVFAQHNVIMHPPFTKIDILSCRNLLIYLDNELQKKMIGLFFYSINPEGILILGSAETLGTQSHLFIPLDAKLKFFKRSNTTLVPELFDFPSSFSRPKSAQFEKQMPDKSILNIQCLADQLLLQHFSPAGVLVNENGDILYISGRTGKYLEPAVGKANMNIFAMLREGLHNEFPAAFRKVIMNKELVVLHNIKVGANGDTQTINVKMQWIDKPNALFGTVMVIFIDVPEISEKLQQERNGEDSFNNLRQKELEEELQRTREEIQNTLEEMQTSQEELKSTNEELQSANEELQSSNEELTTSKEEMQSLNEELQTVNAELQSKVDDFSRVNNDMKNLLNSTDIATLFLDKELNIRRYTNQATKIFKLIKSDIGRPFTDQVSDLIYPELATDALEVLRTLVFMQKTIPTRDGRWFSIRIMPYRTYDDRIDGLVITFFNTSVHMQAEFNLHETKQANRVLLNSSSDAIIKLSAGLKILEFNPNAEKLFDKKHKDVVNQEFINLLIPQSLQRKVEKVMHRHMNQAEDGPIMIKMITAGGAITTIEWSLNILHNKLKIPSGVLLTTKTKYSHD